GMGDPVKQKAEARTLLAAAGFGAGNPMKLTVSTRALAIYVDTASWMVDQLRQVGIDAVLEQIETGVWHPKMTRLDFQVALNLTGTAVDDPDAMLFENFRCGSQRNFSGYCSEEIDRLMVGPSRARLRHQAAPDRRRHPGGDVDGDLRAHAPGAGEHRRHPVRVRRLRGPGGQEAARARAGRGPPARRAVRALDGRGGARRP